MTPQRLFAWSQLAEARAGWRRKRAQPAILVGLALIAYVWWRTHEGGVAAGARAWLVVAIAVSAVHFLRVPFALYWRADAPLLAQLPIEGKALLDVALVRCVRGALGITALLLAAMIPFAEAARGAPDLLGLVARHAALAIGLGAAAAGLIPAVAYGAAVLVVRGGGAHAVRFAVAAATGSPRRAAQAAAELAKAQLAPPENAATAQNASAVLGALPGFASTAVIVAAIAAGRELDAGPVAIEIGAGLVVASAIAFVLARRGGDTMAQVLRDVSALDRQRLATLDLRPPTPLESLFGRLAGAGRLVHGKDARLVRRRYPLAFAIGFVGFVWLVVCGIARPADPAWLVVPLAGGIVYGLVLSARLRVPPIELPRLAATLPLPRSAFAGARIAWLAGWWLVFFAAPGLLGALRAADPLLGLVLVGGGTLLVVGSGAVSGAQ